MKILRFWGPVVLWMITIFLYSSRERITISNEPAINFLFFKTLHVLEYAFLYILNYRAIRNTITKLDLQNQLILAFIITIAYAATDEIHQLFVATREGRARDVIIDAIGASLAWYFLMRLLPKAPRKLRQLAGNWQII